MRKTLIFLAAVLAAACSSLEPTDLPPEFTPIPTTNSLWQSVEAIRTGDWQMPLNDGPGALRWRLRAIDSARDSIDLQTFLWSFDVVGTLVLNRIIRAADRGVKVRLLIDDTFLASEDRLLLAIQQHRNVQYRVFNPYKRRANNALTREILNLAEFHRLDHRMHNKAMVIDNRVAIVGGRNLADEYFGLHDEANFRDMELIVGGPIVREVSTAFDEYWNDPWSVPIDRLSHVTPSAIEFEEARRTVGAYKHLYTDEPTNVRELRWHELVDGAYAGRPALFFDRPPGDDPVEVSSAPVQLAEHLIKLMDEATEEIVIISAYLIPTPVLSGAIRRAAARGVSVRILTNSIRSNNHLAAHSAYRNHIDELMRHGARMHEVRVDARDRNRYMLPPTDRKSLALHAKVLVIDRDKVFIGSANLDPRSLRINTEMGLLIKDQALNARIRADVEPDFREANAWRLEFDETGRVIWVSDEIVRQSQPAESYMQRIEDWLFSQLPLEDEM